MTGERIGAYTLISQIGEGGMGSVWLAEHSLLGSRAAIKMLHANVSGIPDVTARFFNEARATAKIKDAGIVQIFDFGQHGDGRAYIVMELLEGESLDRRVMRVGKLPLPDALRILRQIASSLGVAHLAGIIHRDLKPENVIMVPDKEVPGGERAKIVDFGIAKIIDLASVKTDTAVVMGTPTFMSPEQCRGAGKVDRRSDVYSLGCLLFTLLTGRTPFHAEGAGDIIAMHLREPPPRPSQLVAELPAAVDALVLRCLEKDPERRYASGNEVAEALEALIATGPAGAETDETDRLDETSETRKVDDADEATELTLALPHVTTLSSASLAQPPPRFSPPRDRRLRGAALLVAAAAAAVLILIWRRGDAPRPEQRVAVREPRPGELRTEAAPEAAPDASPKVSIDATVAPPADDAISDLESLKHQDPPLPSPQPPTSKARTAIRPTSAPTIPPRTASALPATPARSAPPARAAAAASTTTLATPPAPSPSPAASSAQPQATAASPTTPAKAAERADISSDLGELCGDQKAKFEHITKNAASLSAAGLIAAARPLSKGCFNRNQRTVLALLAIQAACGINDKAAVLHFYAFADNTALLARCPKFLADDYDEAEEKAMDMRDKER